MNEYSFASAETKVYRLHPIYQVYHYGVGVAALFTAVKVSDFLVLSVIAALFGAYGFARPLVTKVTVDQGYVTFQGMFSKNSLARSSIAAVETKHTGKGSLLVFWGDTGKEERLTIPAIFRFDDEWDQWWSSYRNLSDDKPLNIL